MPIRLEGTSHSSSNCWDRRYTITQGNYSGGRKVERCPTLQSRRAATGRVETTAPARRASSSETAPLRIRLLLALLASHPGPGGVARLSAEQRAQIPALLADGAEAFGFRGDVWTASRVAEVILQAFGVHYSRDHVGVLLRQLGWSRQQPVARATQRDSEAIHQWSQEQWPALKKGGGTANDRRLGRRIGVLLAALSSADVGATRPNADPAHTVQPRPSLRDQRDNAH